ncbi:MAG: hypothetical protein HAW60_03900 [Bdellovibrionales bacterium]|nr:hypothetical protein [Bdellovibrionales bacterium]
MQNKWPLVVSILFSFFINSLVYAKKKQTLKLNRQKISVSKFSQFKLPINSKIKLKDIKPPKTGSFGFPPGTDLRELESITDESIKYLYNLAKRYKKDRDRADIWLRLAKQYFEKSKLVKLKVHKKYHKRKKYKKNINFNASYIYNKKSLKLYLWFLKTFPKDRRSEIVYGFSIKNYLLFDQIKAADSLYVSFLKQYPKSALKEELSFLIADYYFSKFYWKKAKKFYKHALKSRTKKLKYLVYYKLAWIEHKMGKYKSAFYYLNLVLKNTQSSRLFSFKKIAVKDLPYFYSRYGRASSASKLFSKYMSKAEIYRSLGLLAAYYLADGKRRSAVLVWRELINTSPMAESNFEYAYNIIKAHKYSQTATKNIILIKSWLTDYGFHSRWFKHDRTNRKKYVQKQEEYLRYLISTFYNQKKVKNKYKKIQNLLSLYPLYLRNFSNKVGNKEKILEIKFLYADLLFDRQKYTAAQKQYGEIVSFGKSKFYKKALYNRILCTEKRLLSYAEVKKRTNNFSKKLDILGAEKQFEVYAIEYLKTYADLNLEYRLGFFYYNRLQLSLAENAFKQYLQTTSGKKSNRAARKQVLSWLVDIYSKQKDYEKIKTLFALNKGIANSAKFRLQKDKVYFKVAEGLEKQQKYLEAIKEYAKIGLKKSSLAMPSLFNQANLHLKIKNVNKAVGLFKKIKFSKNKSLHKKANLSLVSIYRKRGMYSSVASVLEGLGRHKIKESADWYYNAGVLRKSLKHYIRAINNFNQFLLLSKNTKQKRKVELILVEIYISTNKISKSINLLKKYYNIRTNNKEKYFIGKKLITLYTRLNQISKADWWRQQLLSKYINNRSRFNRYPSIVDIVANIQYTKAEKAFFKLLKLKFSKKLKLQTLTKKKLALLESVKKSLKAVVSLNNSEYLLRSLVLEARSQAHVASFFVNLPVPKSLKAKDKQTYINGVKSFTDPMLVQEKKLYQLTLEKSYDFGVYNDAVVFAYNQISKSKSFKKFNISYFERLKIKFTTSGEFLYTNKYKQKFTTFFNMKKFALSGINNNKINSDYWLILVNAYIGMNFLELAELILDDNNLVKKNLAAYYNDKSVLAWKNNNTAKSLALLKKISNKNLLTAKYPALNLASIYFSYSEFTKASVILEYLNKKDYSFSKFDLNNYAIVAELLKKSSFAKKLYKKALSKDAENPLILFNYAYFLFKSNKKATDVISILERAKVWNSNKKLLKLIKILENKIKEKL